MAEQFFTVTQLAQSLGITARTVRFYDDKGLVTPSRAGTARVYTQPDRARLILILRGKRLGFTLREIKEYLDLYELDRTQKEQLKMLLKGVRKRIDRLEEQSIALKQTLEELRAIEGQATSALTEIDASDAGGERQAG